MLPSPAHSDFAEAAGKLEDATPHRPPFSIASLSLGSCQYHTLPHKIRTAARLGYDGIEIFIPDFEAFVREVGLGAHKDILPPITPLDRENTTNAGQILERRCARAIGNLCHSLGLSIPVFQPFRDFEAFHGDSLLLNAALARAERWISLMPLMRTDLLLVCSNLLPFDPLATTKDSSPFPSLPSPSSFPSSSPSPLSTFSAYDAYVDDLVHAFGALGEVADRYGVRIGYEALAWGTVINHWEQVWSVVERVDRPNVGVILDSFNQLAYMYADPSTETGIRDPAPPIDDYLSDLSKRLEEHPERLFFYQLASALPPMKPIRSSSSQAPPRMTWSRASRVFPGESSFLPVDEFTQIIHKSGYKGAWSLEVFNTSLDDGDAGVVEAHGRRGLAGLANVWDKCGC